MDDPTYPSHKLLPSCYVARGTKIFRPSLPDCVMVCSLKSSNSSILRKWTGNKTAQTHTHARIDSTKYLYSVLYFNYILPYISHSVLLEECFLISRCTVLSVCYLYNKPRFDSFSTGRRSDEHLYHSYIAFTKKSSIPAAKLKLLYIVFVVHTCTTVKFPCIYCICGIHPYLLVCCVKYIENNGEKRA